MDWIIQTSLIGLALFASLIALILTFANRRTIRDKNTEIAMIERIAALETRLAGAGQAQQPSGPEMARVMEHIDRVAQSVHARLDELSQMNRELLSRSDGQRFQPEVSYDAVDVTRGGTLDRPADVTRGGS